MSGFITLHRDIQDHWIFKDPEQFRAWVIMLMAANWEPREVPCGTYVTKCDRGQFIRSQEQLAEMFGWSRSKVQRFLKLLTNARMIRSETAHKANKITIVNYNTYQDKRSNSDQKMINRRSEDDQKMGTENNINNINNINNDNPEDMTQIFDKPIEPIKEIPKVDVSLFFQGKVHVFKKSVDEWFTVLSDHGQSLCDKAYLHYIKTTDTLPVYPSALDKHIRDAIRGKGNTVTNKDTKKLVLDYFHSTKWPENLSNQLGEKRAKELCPSDLDHNSEEYKELFTKWAKSHECNRDEYEKLKAYIMEVVA